MRKADATQRCHREPARSVVRELREGRGAVKFIEDDGGRKVAGFRGATGDCACRAIAIATGLPYRFVYDLINDFAANERFSRSRKVSFAAATRRGSSARAGIMKATMKKVMAHIGGAWTPTMQVGSGCHVHCRDGELPADGRYVVVTSRHYVALVDGALRDTYDPARDGTRCVYGYWKVNKLTEGELL
jgi:hypothetical protein